MFVLPVAARLALWGTAALRSHVLLPQAVAAIQRDDEPHEVTSMPAQLLPDLATGPSDLTLLLRALADRDVRRIQVVLPAAGDPRGLPGPPAFNEQAVAAGQAVLVTLPAGELGLVPQVTRFGSTWEPGTLVSWQAATVANSRSHDIVGVAEADRQLRSALRVATEELARLDVARWREDAADRLATIRDGGLERGTVPDSTSPQCLRVLASALRVRAIVALAEQDDGAAVSGLEAQRRRQALTELAGVCRRAITAAVNDPEHVEVDG